MGLWNFACTVLLLSASVSSFAVSYERIPLPESFSNSFVSDAADILSADNERRLDADLVSYYEATGNQIAVVTTEDTRGSASPKNFATDLFKRLELGEADVDNGLLILLSTGDRRVEFETGYGLEGYLPDVTLHRIQQARMIPSFKAGDYEQGLLDGTYATIKALDEAVIRDASPVLNPASPNHVTTEGFDSLTNSVDAVIRDNPKSFNSPDFLRKLLLGNTLLFILYLLASCLRGRQSKYSSKNPLAPTLTLNAINLKSQALINSSSTKKTHCVYCKADVLKSDEVTDIALKDLHFSVFDRKMSTSGSGCIRIYKCNGCDFINKTYDTFRPLLNCKSCLSKSVYFMHDDSHSTKNHLNVYRDHLHSHRTEALQSVKFDTVLPFWSDKATTHLTIYCCFICNATTQSISDMVIPHLPKKPPIGKLPDSDHVVRSPKTKPALKPTKVSKRPSIPKKTRSVSNRKRGGDSGGGGAGSSW